LKVLNPRLFDLNPSRRIDKQIIGKQRNEIIIIDDLFLYPMEIKEVMDQLVFTTNKNIRGESPCFRGFIPMDGEKISRELVELNWDRYEIREKSVKPFWSVDQYIDHSDIIEETNYHPHIDTYDLLSTPFLAVVIYMNKRNLHGGTQFLRDEEIGESVDNQSDINKLLEKWERVEINKSKPWNYHARDWEQYHLVPMKFNRLVSYRNNLLHSPYTNGSFYRNHPRKTIVSTF